VLVKNMLSRFLSITLFISVALLTTACEPGVMEDESWKETEGPGLFTGKRGGIILYQR